MILTKVFGILCVVFFVVQAKKVGPEEKEMFMMFTEECRKANKATDEDMNHIMDGNIPESKEAKCTMTCTMKQFKMAEEKDGKMEVNVENLVKMAEANGVSKENCTIIEEIGNKCKSPPVDDQCNFSAEVAKCVKKEGEARGYDIDSI